MPIINDNSPLIKPAKSIQLAKYLDITKLLSLLSKESLFFCRLDKLEDAFEGTSAKRNFDYRISDLKMKRDSGYFEKKFTDAELEEKVKILFEVERKKKSIICVNCWNKIVSESAALWKIYAESDKGIMIKTSLQSLEKSLAHSTHSIRISEVLYIDHEFDLMPDHNYYFPIIHKNHAYQYEEEVRLIFETTPGHVLEYDWTQEENQNGKYIPIDPSLLIEEIVLGPHSPKWFYEIIKDILQKYNLNSIPVNKSKLLINRA